MRLCARLLIAPSPCSCPLRDSRRRTAFSPSLCIAVFVEQRAEARSMSGLTRWCVNTAIRAWDQTMRTANLVYNVGDQLRIVYKTANSHDERKRDFDATVLRAGGFLAALVLCVVVDAQGGVPNMLRWLCALVTTEGHANSSAVDTADPTMVTL
ncbi:hypothetical protein, conserved [Leishmania tarentolae]|uniref:Uncharacterized protein n=1 Tax=Leishmania tarentolae TaxID=5689 RepID=A0A640KF53_LEITA|nr:hypothetical protein, conserved [Leishmania tarentolae]